MEKKAYCDENRLNKGAWTATEDELLVSYINASVDQGKWTSVPKKAGLKRSGKSCRLRWLNYLRPNIKRGNISDEEDELIIRLHKLLGNRWYLIAGRLPGRTDNEIKNYWNTTLSKKVQNQKIAINKPQKKPWKPKSNPQENNTYSSSSFPQAKNETPSLIRTKALRCTKASYPCFPVHIPSSTDGVDRTQQIIQQNFEDELMQKNEESAMGNGNDLLSFDDAIMWADGLDFDSWIKGVNDDDGILIDNDWVYGSLETDIWMNF